MSFTALLLIASQAFGLDCAPYATNQICGSYSMVSASLTEATNSPQKCAEFVYDECKYKDFFTWRSTNYACHCVEVPNCDSPSFNSGLNIYQISTCIEEANTPVTEAPVVTDAPVTGGRFADSFGVVDVAKNDVLDYEDVERAVASLSAWANEFNAHHTQSLDHGTVMALINEFDDEQNELERSILALDVNQDGYVDSNDIQHYTTIKNTAQTLLTDLTNDIADARDRLGKESMTTAEIEQFFQNARDSRRAELLGYFTHLGGTETKAISLDEFQRFYSDLMVYMAIMNKVKASVPDFELTRQEYDTFHQDLNVVEVATAETAPRVLEPVDIEM